jgi:hypothetical protein
MKEILAYNRCSSIGPNKVIIAKLANREKEHLENGLKAIGHRVSF